MGLKNFLSHQPEPNFRGVLPGLSSQTAPVQLRAGRGQSQARPRPSSSQEAAGRAGRAGQATQEKPRLVPPLPPRGPGDREARGFPDRGRRRTFRPQHAAPQALQLRGPRGAAGGGGGGRPRPSRSGRGKGGGSGGRAGGEAAEGSERGRGGAKRRSWAATPPAATRGAAETRRPAAQGRRPGRSGLRASGSFASSAVAWLSDALAPLRPAVNPSAPPAPRAARRTHAPLLGAASPHSARSCCGSPARPSLRRPDERAPARACLPPRCSPACARKCVAGGEAPPFGPGRQSAPQLASRKTFPRNPRRSIWSRLLSVVRMGELRLLNPSGVPNFHLR